MHVVMIFAMPVRTEVLGIIYLIDYFIIGVYYHYGGFGAFKMCIVDKITFALQVCFYFRVVCFLFMEYLDILSWIRRKLLTGLCFSLQQINSGKEANLDQNLIGKFETGTKIKG